MTFFEKIFFAHFSDQKTRKNFKKNEKFEKLPKMAQILKILKNAPKSFRNWVKPIMGTKKWHFSRKFFSPIFQTKKLGKISKKWKI